MKVKDLLGQRLRETPTDCSTANSTIMVRGGYIKQMSSGIYSLFMPGKRICRKIEEIIREEMDALNGQEVQFPVSMPASIWEESGRYYSIGSEMARWIDRSGAKMVLGMTHEEAAVHLAKSVAVSHLDFPFMIYQIQTKFRDEPRSRGGLIRVREFTMKDAYSFHTTQESLDDFYDRCLLSYLRIFARVGLEDVVSVKSDSGMMGGSIAHEFMFLNPIGEDSIAVCSNCNYRANVEAANCVIEPCKALEKPLKKTPTPECKTISEVCELLGATPEKTCKAVVYQKNQDDTLVVVFIRGDREVNETKLRNALGFEIHAATNIADESGLIAGFIGPIDLDGDIVTVFDRSLCGAKSLICGANEIGFHYVGLSMERDCKGVSYIDVAKCERGDICPVCGKKSIAIHKGVEVGNIFKLGTKYTRAMDMAYQDRDGTMKNPIMGCYGIGIGRLAACVCERFHDDFGPIWPMSVAPWQIQICALSTDKNSEVKRWADAIYAALTQAGVEVLYDDRRVSNGVMLTDADLFGCPLRMVVSPRNCKNGIAELTSRDKSLRMELNYLDNAIYTIVECVKQIIEKQLHEQRALADRIVFNAERS